jgi:hypothetical protein
VPTVGVPADSTAKMPPSAGAVWVERRRSRQERRRVDVPGLSAPFEVQTTEPLEAASRTSFLRRLKPIHTLPGLTLALAIALLAPSRWNRPAQAVAPLVGADFANGAPAKVASPVASTAPTPPPLAPPPTESTGHESKSKKPGPDEAITTRRRVAKNRVAKAASSGDDSIDPFAPSPSNPPSRPRKLDSDFVDPFGP